MTIAPLILALLATPVAVQGDGPVILDFTAPWCQPCQQMKPAVAQLVSKGYPVEAVDYDRSPLVKKYNVTSIPTFIVVGSDGQELARTSGYQPARNIAELYNKVQDPSDPEPEPAAGEARDEVPARKNPEPWKTVVRIKIENNLGRQKTWEFGSGTIIHSTPEETIILTCAHIFKIVGARKQFAPRQFPLKIEVHLSDGILRQLSETDSNGGYQAGVHMVGRYEGEAIDYDFGGDVGLIRIRPGKRLPATPVVPAQWSAKPGLDMTTVGCSESNDATAWSTKISRPLIRGVDGFPNYEAIECLYAPKQGRSGGGLYTIDGQLAGVCDFAEPRGGRGLYATPRTIHRFLDKNDLKFCYAPEADPRNDNPGSLMAQGQAPSRANRSNVADRLRAQNLDEPPRKKLTIPSPEDLQVPSLASEDGLERSGSRRKPAFPAQEVAEAEDRGRVRAGGGITRQAALDAIGADQPTPTELSTDSRIDRDPFEDTETPERGASPRKPSGIPAPKTGGSSKIWKPRKVDAVPSTSP